MSQAYSCRPSEFLGPIDPVSAFYFDRAVFEFGSDIDSELEAAGENAKTARGGAMKRQMVLNRWLRAEGGGRFKDPAAR